MPQTCSPLDGSAAMRDRGTWRCCCSGGKALRAALPRLKLALAAAKGSRRCCWCYKKPPTLSDLLL